MTDRKRQVSARCTVALALAAATGTGLCGGIDYRLARASADGGGGGVATGTVYALVLAYGQPDVNPPAFSARYAFAGGVFADVPTDRVFADGFE